MREKIYLAGLPRGGTTLFSMVLGQNSSIKQMGESMYIPILNPKDVLCSCGEKSCKILEKVYERAKIIDSIKEIPRIYGVIDKMREPQKIPHKFTLQHSCCNMNEHNFYESIVKACNGLDDLVNIFRSILGDYIYVDNTKEILFAKELLNRP